MKSHLCPSLIDVMNEELAKKLQDEEFKNLEKIQSSAQSTRICEDRCDLDVTAIEDNDYILAEALQEAEYFLEQQRLFQIAQRPSPNKYEKVTLTTDYPQIVEYLNNDEEYADICNECQHFPIHDDDSDDFSFRQLPTRKPHHGRIKINGRQPKSTCFRSVQNEKATKGANQHPRPQKSRNGSHRGSTNNSDKKTNEENNNNNNSSNSNNEMGSIQSRSDVISEAKDPKKITIGWDDNSDYSDDDNEDEDEDTANENVFHCETTSPSGSVKSSGSNRKRPKRDLKQEVVKPTTEGVLDGRTRLLLYKMFNTGLLKEIHGCISQGKEARVYHAVGGIQNSEYAVKIYKTTLNEFKNRERYIEGDRRFRHHLTHQNPRKIITVWAEKEMRNLKRLESVGVNVPKPIALKKHLLVMSFIGKDGWPAPQLNLAQVDDEKLATLYLQIIKMMRKMYQKGQLVHADLNQFNILVWRGLAWIIDVAQAVEYNHPNSLYFLRRDCYNITKFFHRKDIKGVLSTKELFQFVTDSLITDDNEDVWLNNKQKEIGLRGAEGQNFEEAINEEVFMQSFLPRNLFQVVDPEYEIQKIVDGEETASELLRYTSGHWKK